MIITIDGPAGSGKSTMARLLALKLSASFLDTGAMYRAVTLAAMQAGIDLSDQDKLLGVIQTNKFEFSVIDDKMSIRINGLDVTEQLRSPQVTANSRYIASAPKAREKLVQMQRQFATTRQKIVTEGRDQGTVAFPDADIKFYLTADPAARALRRQAELRAKGDDQTLEQIQKAIEERDKSDRNRTVGPLKPADDAVIIDTTDLSIDGVVEKLLSCVKEKCLKEN
ncbi:MAG: (d)CMP kinase [Planctomycetes bacterium]|nr:(d)CMP kinase [Planctomycetota bacterium]